MWDVVVVGAGPAGSATAWGLARRGLTVALLDRATFPRDKSCGDGITHPGVQILLEMGVLPALPAHTIVGARMHMRGQGAREIPFDGATSVTVPRKLLDAELVRCAAAAGATVVEGIEVREPWMEKGRVVGVIGTNTSGQATAFRGRAVVAADGATSRLARSVGLRGAPGPELGMALRGYYEVDAAGDWMDFHLLLTDVTRRKLLPSYGWVFPTGARTVNVGVGVFQASPGTTVRQLMDQYVERLRGEPGFSGLRPAGPWRGAPLRFDFDPDRSARDGLFLVGDAAGLVSPFTGEGISYALESGLIAADTLAGVLHRGGLAASAGEEYALRLGARFAGYFESGRHAGAKYRSVWRFLRAGFPSDRPIHALARQRILAPDATTHALEKVGAVLPPGLDVRRPMMRVARLLDDAVRRDWPFLVRLVDGQGGPSDVPLRPSLLTIVCAAVGGAETGVCEAAASIELAALSMVAHAGAADSEAPESNAFAILMAELLLARSYELSAALGADASGELAEALRATVAAQVRRHRQAGRTDLTRAELLGGLHGTVGALGGVACRLGARLGGSPVSTEVALADFGRHFAVAHALIDECRAAEGAEDAAARQVLGDLQDGLFGLSATLALAPTSPNAADLAVALATRPMDMASVAALIAASGALDDVRAEAQAEAALADAALASVPPGPAVTALRRLLAFALDRHPPPPPDVDALFGPYATGSAQ